MKPSTTNKNISPSSNRKKRSEEINDIIDRMPMTFGRWVAIAAIAFSILLLFFGWIIRYPDTVTGKIKINSQTASVRMVAHSTGNLQLLSCKPQAEVKEGDYIAIIQNPASTNDIKKITDLIEAFDPNALYFWSDSAFFPDKVSLGDLDLKYYTFLAAFKAQCDYEKENIYQTQKAALLNEIKWKKVLLAESEKMLGTARERLDLSKKWFERYVTLNKALVATYEYEVDQVKTNYLAIKQEVQNIVKEVASIRMQIAADLNQVSHLEVEQKDKERNLKLNLLSSYHDLNDNIKAWEQKYVFKAPLDGRLEFLQFLVNGQTVQAGEEVFAVIPVKSAIYGQMLLPANGAGKVREGSPVRIKLDNYPYMEYGSIEGAVTSISQLSQSQKVAESTVDIYLIHVELPDGLKTNYGEVLDFKYEIAGTADIIVRKRRLIERLFDNLKYRTKHE